MTLYAVRMGAARELNPIIRRLLERPILFICFEGLVFILFVWAVLALRDWYALVGYCLATAGIVWRGWLIVNNIRIVRRARTWVAP